jgi:GrpB-like predicted nucleotidyltransferase (UPF0157 family)
MGRTVEIVNYDATWPEAFANEAQLIKEALAGPKVDILHIGSTAVPGMPAKPIIDILLVVDSLICLDQSDSNLRRLGYAGHGEFGIAGRRFYSKGGDNRTHHLHAFESGSPEIDRLLRFRDFLRESEETAKDYTTLKLNLAQKHKHDPLAYSEAKSEFIHDIDAIIRKRRLTRQN